VTVGSIVVLVLVGLGVAVLVAALGDRGQTSTLAPGEPTSSTAPVDSARIFVHVLGAVERPGLYELQEGDRAVDAIAAAGGYADAADQAQLNLARFVVDGEQIVVPAIGEGPPIQSSMDAAGKVNLNTADQAALETLPRVGPAMAQRIIDWRESNGRFTAVEDLLNVTGVGEKTFESLRELVTI
jgi:competence protein ComEA